MASEDSELRSSILAGVNAIAMLVGIVVVALSLPGPWFGGVFLGLLILALGAVALLRIVRRNRRARAP